MPLTDYFRRSRRAPLLARTAPFAVGLLLVGCGADAEPAGSGKTPVAPERVEVAALASEPKQFLGEVVEVTAQVDDALVPRLNTGRSFVIKDADSQVLVVPQQLDVVPEGLDAGDRVRVRGKVRAVAPDQDEGAQVVPEGGILERFAELPSIEAASVETVS